MVVFFILCIISGVYAGIVLLDIPFVSPFEVITNTVGMILDKFPLN